MSSISTSNNSTSNKIANYGVEEYFLYNSYKKNYKLYEQMINRFFKKNAHRVLEKVKSMVASSGMVKNAVFYDIYKQFIDKFEPDLAKLVAAETGRQKIFIKYVDELFIDEKINFTNAVYVDYGCNDGAFAVAIATRFKIKPSNVYCCDIINKPALVSAKNYNYVKIDLNNVAGSLSSLPKTDLLTVINVFHHIPPSSRAELFKFFDLCLKPNAYTIVKEHNCNTGLYNDEYKNYIKEWHKLYAVLYNEVDFMGDINFISIDHLKVYMIGTHSLIKSYIFEGTDKETDDILKPYYALFLKYRVIV